MKRLGSSDSLGAMIPVCTSAEEKISGVYNRGFQPTLDGLEEEDCVEESGQTAEKKRRLSVEQVKALEKNFEVENKLEPERKLKLAQELGLQPRQVAVWFQNRRARWKTKQLERDYSHLKANYEALKVNYEALSHDKEALLTEIRELKSKLQGSFESDLPIKEEIVQSESEQKVSEQQSQITAVISGSENATATDQNPEHYGELFGELKDGSSDSDSSAILNDDNSPHSANSSGVLPQMMASPSSLRYNFSSSSSSSNSMANCLQFSDLRLSASAQKGYYHQFLRMEEPNFGEEACNFFSDEQAPTLSWYCPETLN